MTLFRRADPDLLRRFREGDREALAAVYREYVGAVAQTVAATLRRCGRDSSHGDWKVVATEVPDLVQEVFVRAFDARARVRFDGTRLYGPFLGAIARHVVIDHLRRRYRQPVIEAAPPGDERPLVVLSGEDVDPFGDAMTAAVVARYVGNLPQDLREVHDALYVRGLSQREAAAALGLGRQVVRTLEARLREGLRLALAAAGRLESFDDAGVPSHRRAAGSGEQAGRRS